MLLDKNGGRRDKSDLLARLYRFERRTQSDFRLAVADVAAKQPVHNARAFHIFFNLFNRGQLIFGFFKRERFLELAHHAVVGQKCKTLGFPAVAVQLF